MLVKTDKPVSIGFVYVNERTNMDSRAVSSMDITDRNGVFFVSFDTVLQSFGTMNRNGRVYNAQNVWKSIVESERIQSYLKDNAWYGEMDHPVQEFENMKLSPERLQTPSMERRSHKIMSPRLDGNLLKARIQTASGTEFGVGFAKEVIQGLLPAFSCRAVAVMEMVNGQPTVSVKRMITYDWVLFPSHKEAHMVGDPSLHSKSLPIIKECGEVYDVSGNPTSKVFRDFIAPLKDLLGENAETDSSINTLMESCGLEPINIVGVTKSGNHTLVRDSDNIIYVNNSLDTKRRLTDFFSSF